MNAYVEFNPDVFRGKTILCPCDDPEWSNFTKYFAQNFTRFGLKKLISTSYAKSAGSKQLTFFEESSPQYDAKKHETHGKLFTLTSDRDGDGRIDSNDLVFSGYLEGDGDFRSPEVTRLRDEADFIITNPPFSLFREFLNWIIQGGKRFIIVKKKNAITYKEVFPLLKNNALWLGTEFPNGNAFFRIEENEARDFADGVYDKETGLVKFRNVGWFTNVDLAQRHQPLALDTMSNNLKYNKKLKKKFESEYNCDYYPPYDNYDALEVPFTECIPSDYDGVMGVPITFLDRYCPEQFNIIDITKTGAGDPTTKTKEYPRQTQVDKNGTHSSVTKLNDGANIRIESPPIGKTYYIVDDAIYIQVYPRILIRPKKGDRQ